MKGLRSAIVVLGRERGAKLRALSVGLTGVVPVVLAGCAATPQADALLAARGQTAVGAIAPPASTGRAHAAVPVAADLPAAVRLDDVPAIAQRAHLCGPASLAMALAASGRPVDPDALAPDLFVPGLAGTLQGEMLAAPRRHGRLAVVLPQRLDALLREVAAGTPVVVLQNVALDAWPVWHYAVVVGYDLGRGDVLLHSAENAWEAMPIRVFERLWARADRWAIAVAAPQRLPVSAEPADLRRALAGLERIDPAAARIGWTSLLQRRPGDRLALLGAGNAALATGDADGAAAAWRELVALHPDEADGWNNLAHALRRLGDRAGAVRAAERAVELGGPRAGVYEETRREMLEEGGGAVPPAR